MQYNTIWLFIIHKILYLFSSLQTAIKLIIAVFMIYVVVHLARKYSLKSSYLSELILA